VLQREVSDKYLGGCVLCGHWSVRTVMLRCFGARIGLRDKSVLRVRFTSADAESHDLSASHAVRQQLIFQIDYFFCCRAGFEALSVLVQ
jgi:hypothetical protein